MNLKPQQLHRLTTSGTLVSSHCGGNTLAARPHCSVPDSGQPLAASRRNGAGPRGGRHGTTAGATGLGCRSTGHVALTSSPTKAEAARQGGAAEVYLYSDDWAAQLRSTGRVNVAFDVVGTTSMQGFEAVRTSGRAVFYGIGGGFPPADGHVADPDRGRC
ncbi:hypothetical protein E7T06_16125 [Deinococcus sp. Arct2-2]|nr:hypothetical protein E7T06_16125 [Deinococcus sp. Arct2-2]